MLYLRFSDVSEALLHVSVCFLFLSVGFGFGKPVRVDILEIG